MPSLLAADNPTIISYPIPGEDDAGYIEVKAVEDPTGSLRDEIIIVLPLADGVLDGQQSADDDDETDPLYFYPTKKQQQKHLHEGDTDSESDSDDEEDEARDRFDVTLAPESKELEYSFMEELMQTLDAFFGCSYGTACTEAISPPGVVKSILRRKKDSDPCTPPINRNVSFTKLEIREFNMTLGNHPSAVSVSLLQYCIGSIVVG